MSLPQNGKEMELPEDAGGSVRRARERMEAGMVREDQPGTGRPQPRALQGRTGPIGAAISRPTQIPQWPLPTFPTPEPYSGPESNQQAARRQQPPQRPPRPSHVPSILDGSRIQDPTPVFQYQARDVRDSDQESNYSVPPAPSSLQTDSSASVPDFPMPTATGPPAMPHPRRSVTLGPPPSSRRGASSFYSNISYVSPIPEESPRIRSHTSLASSAAMPESWGSMSAGNSPGYSDVHYGDSTGSSFNEPGQEDGGGSKIVRSASIGKRGKPHIVMNKAAPGAGASQPTDWVPAQENPFADGTGLANASSSDSLRVPSKSLTPLSAAASSSESMQSRRAMAPPPGMGYNRLSAIRRPPRLDMEAVEKAQARGSITSLPDLIRRATRLAAIIDRGGKRPGSRFDPDYPDEKMGGAYSDGFSGKFSVLCATLIMPSLVLIRALEQVWTIHVSPGSPTCWRHFPLPPRRPLAQAAWAVGSPHGHFRRTTKTASNRTEESGQGVRRKVIREGGNIVVFHYGGSSWSSLSLSVSSQPPSLCLSTSSFSTKTTLPTTQL